MKQITNDQLETFKFLSNLQANPSRTKAAFSVHQPNIDENNYQTNLWVYEKQRLFQLTSSNKDSQYIWEDDETILFNSARDKKDDPSEETTFYRIKTSGGEATKAFTLKVNVSQIKKLDNHRFLFLASSDIKHPNLFELKDKKRTEILKERKDNNFVDILEGIPWWMNGQQIIDKTRTRLFIYETDKEKLTPLTDPKFSVDHLYLSDDKQEIIVLGSEYTDVAPLHNHMISIDSKNFKQTILIDSDRWSMNRVESINNELIVVSSDVHREMLNQNTQFRKYDSQNKTLVNIDNQELLLGNSIGSDVRFGSSKALLRLENQLVYNATIQDHSELYSFDGQQSVNEINFDGSIDGFCNLNGNYYVIGQYQQGLQEFYQVSNNHVKKLSDFNNLDDYYVAKPQTFTFESNGDTLKGYVLLPQDFNPKKQYPAILDIHGGPKTVYGEIFYHEMQVWANQGYVVFYTNPHGSDGISDAYSDIFGQYGSIDYEDIMTLTDQVLQRYPNIDQSRLGVTGGSYGGFMTNWIIGHTDRFKVAATQRSISNWVSFYGVSDIGYYFVPDQGKGDIFSEEGLTKLWDQSPLKYVNNMNTPTLIVHSKFDYRCPIDQGYQLFTALKVKGVETKMVVLNEENHDLSRSGKPKARLVRLNQITDWMNHYLK